MNAENELRSDRLLLRRWRDSDRSPILHDNRNRLDRYIAKHNEYSNWEAKVWLEGQAGHVKARLFGNQAERRRWLKRMSLMVPGSPFVYFLHLYVLRLGFLGGMRGLLYCRFQAIQIFHIKAKIWEARHAGDKARV